MTTSPPRPNFFLLLGLNPDAVWNQAQFENVLKDKINQWARDSAGVAKKALTAKTYRALVPKIREVMADPVLRAQEAAAARAELAKDQQARKEQFEQQLAFINAKDTIIEEEINKFVDTFKDIFSARKIRSLIKPKVIAPNAASSSTVLPLEASLAKNIADLLQIVHMSSLYELLERPSKTATPELYRAAEALYAQMVRLPPSADVTVKSQLAGLARDVFRSNEMQARYDETLRQSSLNQQLKELDDFMIISKEKELNANQIQIFLEKAQKRGWEQKESFERLKDHARLRKWILTAPKIAEEQKILCPNCESLNDRSQRFCTTCNRELFIGCPRCGTEVSCELIACGSCGFAIGNRYLVDNLLEELPKLLKAGQLKRAEEIIAEIEEAWQTGKEDARTQQIRRHKSTVNSLMQAQQRAEKEFEDQLRRFIQQKQYFAARQLLITKGEHLPDREARCHKVDEVIQQTQDLFKQALGPNVSRDNKVELCRQALALCADYQQARELLKTMPPAPPCNLRAQIQGMTVTLSWSASTTPGTSYRIVRKGRAQPNATTDGKALGTVTGLSYADSTPEVGLPLYYAVYAVIDEVASAQGALITQPVMLMQEVTNATAQVDHQQVTLSWSPPSHVHSVAVVRKEQTPPASMQDGRAIGEYTSFQGQLIDKDVKEAKTYYYRISCRFENVAGQLVSTQGIVVRAIPEVPPAPPKHLEIREINHTIHINWQPPGKGSVMILKSTQALRRDGQVLPEGQLSALGQRLEAHGNSTEDTWEPAAVIYYTPVVIFQRTAYIGPSQHYVCIDDVRDIKYQHLVDSAVRLRWTWPEDCQEACISYSTTRETQHNIPPAVTCRISRAEYDHLGYYDIHGERDQEYDILVSAILRHQGEKVVARGFVS